jgi:hypothetical protein
VSIPAVPRPIVPAGDLRSSDRSHQYSAGPVADMLWLNTGVAAHCPRWRIASIDRWRPAGFERRRLAMTHDISFAWWSAVCSRPLSSSRTTAWRWSERRRCRMRHSAILECSGRDRRYIDPGEPGGGPVQLIRRTAMTRRCLLTLIAASLPRPKTTLRRKLAFRN